MSQVEEIHKAIQESGDGGDSLLAKAMAVTMGPRRSAYGLARENHETIARLWSVILGIEVTYQQVIQCMVALKLARLNTTPDHEDSWLDIAGYAAVWDKAQRGL